MQALVRTFLFLNEMNEHKFTFKANLLLKKWIKLVKKKYNKFVVLSF